MTPGLLQTPRFIEKTPGDVSGGIICRLCPHNCRIKSGSFGNCGVRGNKGGMGIIPFYGFVSCLALDPIEKKPLYHFKPGSQILSVGFFGCNLRCPFCQNWRISQDTGIFQNENNCKNTASGKWMKPGDVVSAALKHGSPSIAYTYSEPLVHLEYMLDCMALARKHGIANVLVTNGCINKKASMEILGLACAANIDLKCFSHDTYAKILGGSLETTLDFIRMACTRIHVEITTLLVSGLNDSSSELNACADFIAGLETAVPWHLSAYHPDYRWNAPPTNPVFLLNAAKEAQKKLPYVYAGNISQEENNTACSCCGVILVSRKGYRTDISGLAPQQGAASNGEKNYRCVKCGKAANIVC